MKINLASFISAQCASVDDGQVFFKKVYPEIKEGMSVKIDFEGVELILTPFLHHSIGRLLEYFGKETVMEKLILCNISRDHLKHINNYIDRTEQQQFQTDSRETLMELFEEDELGDSGL